MLCIFHYVCTLTFQPKFSGFISLGDNIFLNDGIAPLLFENVYTVISISGIVYIYSVRMAQKLV